MPQGERALPALPLTELVNPKTWAERGASLVPQALQLLAAEKPLAAEHVLSHAAYCVRKAHELLEARNEEARCRAALHQASDTHHDARIQAAKNQLHDAENRRKAVGKELLDPALRQLITGDPLDSAPEEALEELQAAA
jgi:hypothetical protein